MRRKQTGKKSLALLLALCMLSVLMPLSASAEEEPGALTVTGGIPGEDYTYENHVLTIKTEAPLTVSGTTTMDRIVIGVGCTPQAPAHLTISGLEINVSETDDQCAFSVPSGSAAEVTFQGENTLKSGDNRAGLEVPGGAKLLLSGENGGTLTAEGGNGGAGIGGGDKTSAGELTITGGTVNASTVNNASGIGGGWKGGGGTISILGGVVTARGGMGAGIGDGGGEGKRSFGAITIRDAFVTATGSWRADGIGKEYRNTGSGTLEIFNSWVRSSRLVDSASLSNSVILDDSKGCGTVYGDYTLTADWTLGESELLRIPVGTSLTVDEGSTLQIEGHLLLEENGQRGELTGSIAGNTEWFSQSSDEMTFSLGTPTEGNGFSWNGAKLTLAGGWCYTEPVVLPAGAVLELEGESTVFLKEGRPLTFQGDSAIQGDGELQLLVVDWRSQSPAISAGGDCAVSGSVKVASSVDYVDFSFSGGLSLSDTAELASQGEIAVTGALVLSGQANVTCVDCSVSGSLTLTDSAWLELNDVGATISVQEEIILSGNASLSTLGEIHGNRLSVSEHAGVSASGSIGAGVIQGSDDASLTAFDGISAENIDLSGHAEMEGSGEEYGVSVTNLSLSDSASLHATGSLAEEKYESWWGCGLQLEGKVTRRDNAVLFADSPGMAILSGYISSDSSLPNLDEMFDFGNADLHGAAAGFFELQRASEENLYDENRAYFVCSYFPAGEEPAEDGSNALKSVKITPKSAPPYTPPVQEPELPFEDVPEGAWYYEDVKYAYENGLFLGVTDTEFAPKEPMAREMLVTVLYRAAGEPELPDNLGYPFADVDAESYYANAVYWARANGIVFGVDGEHFGTGSDISRQDLCCMLYRYAEYAGMDVSVEGDLSAFTDVGKIPGYAEKAMSWATAKGIIAGKGNGILDPRGSASRCEEAAMLHRFLTL